MFNAKWTERDEAVFVDLLHRKIGELKYDIKYAESPSEKAHLRSLRVRYQVMLEKVKNGDYNPHILASEMASATVYNQSTQVVTKERVSNDRYADSYADINFDYDKYFAKTRYYGTAVPLISLILVAVFLFLTLCGTFLSTETVDAYNYMFSASSTRVTLDSIGYFKIAAGETDFLVPNDGDWPSGTFANEEESIAYGTIYLDANGNAPDYVYLAEDLGMNTINITVVEVIRAVFRMSFLSSTRLDYIEDLESMEGRSWYYYKYISTREDSLTIEKDENGDYDAAAIVRVIATYGTIISLCLMIIFAFIEIFMNIGRLFSFTTRKLHKMPFMILLCGLFTLLLPAFLELQVFDSANITASLSNYFTMYWIVFVDASFESTATVVFNLFFALYLIIPLVVMILPKFFHNRVKKVIRFVPKGNKAHTYAGQTMPTKAGDPIPTMIDPKAKKSNKGNKAAKPKKVAKPA